MRLGPRIVCHASWGNHALGYFSPQNLNARNCPIEAHVPMTPLASRLLARIHGLARKAAPEYDKTCNIIRARAANMTTL